MNCKSGSKHERTFIEAVRLEIAGGSTLFSRETVQALIECYEREAARFDALAGDVAYSIEQDEHHLDTMYSEFTRRLVGGEAEAYTIPMRDQIDRYAMADQERRDGT